MRGVQKEKNPRVIRRVTAEKFDAAEFAKILPLTRPRGNNGGKNKIRLLDSIITFDIESSYLPEINHNIMYVWMLYSDKIGKVITGRTWDSFFKLLHDILDIIPSDAGLCVWVHNLSYEFIFLSGLYHFAPEDVFCVDSYKILRATMFGGRVELRCSWLHSNMSLDQYTSKMRVEHGKLSGVEFDYSKRRLPWTPLTRREWAYCCNDVVGLAEALDVEMRMFGDTLYTIPLTSTGYVRRDAKAAMRACGRGMQSQFALTEELYNMIKESFRGGDTHSNRHYAGMILPEVHSRDISSSYPSQLVLKKFPTGRFRKDDDLSFDHLADIIRRGNKAALFRVRFHKIELQDESWGFPYIPIAKCRNIPVPTRLNHDIDTKIDNGRVLCAPVLEITLTDVDMRIIAREYKWKGTPEVLDLYTANYGWLPHSMVELVLYYFTQKTELKGVEGQEIFYGKMKALVNALYGLCAQDGVKPSTLYMIDRFFDEGNGQLFFEDETPLQQRIEKYNQKAFMAFQWAPFVTAHAREDLHVYLRHVHKNGGVPVYCDTDSVKYLGEVSFDELNALKRRQCEERRTGNKYRPHADDPKGERHYLGLFEAEPDYRFFCTLGAKKYAYVYYNKPGTHCTIAGVSKSASREHPDGGRELDREAAKMGIHFKWGVHEYAPGIALFERCRDIGKPFTFHEAGGKRIAWNVVEKPFVHQLPEGGTVLITSNAVISDDEYTLKVHDDYYQLIRNNGYISDEYFA